MNHCVVCGLYDGDLIEHLRSEIHQENKTRAQADRLKTRRRANR